VPLMSDFFVPDDDVPPPGVTVQPLPSVGGAQKAR
jgi:citronellol/citronellal dehydrogenase